MLKGKESWILRREDVKILRAKDRNIGIKVIPYDVRGDDSQM
jgi:hypothetical protein